MLRTKGVSAETGSQALAEWQLVLAGAAGSSPEWRAASEPGSVMESGAVGANLGERKFSGDDQRGAHQSRVRAIVPVSERWDEPSGSIDAPGSGAANGIECRTWGKPSTVAPSYFAMTRVSAQRPWV